VLAGGRLILVNSNGRMLEVGAVDGKVGRETKAGSRFTLNPIVADNMLYLLDGKGNITAWR
jgi:hypothetical protein